MPNKDDFDLSYGVIDRINNSIVALSYPVKICLAGDFFVSMGSRINRQLLDGC